MSYPEVSRNRQKPEGSCMAADGHTDNFQGLASFLNIWIFLMDFFLKDSA